MPECTLAFSHFFDLLSFWLIFIVVFVFRFIRLAYGRVQLCMWDCAPRIMIARFRFWCESILHCHSQLMIATSWYINENREVLAHSSDAGERCYNLCSSNIMCKIYFRDLCLVKLFHSHPGIFCAAAHTVTDMPTKHIVVIFTRSTNRLTHTHTNTESVPECLNGKLNFVALVFRLYANIRRMCTSQ